jgi:hypothetical protein
MKEKEANQLITKHCQLIQQALSAYQQALSAD